MNVDQEFIRKVAANARLELTDAEVEKFIPEFKEILENFSSMDEIKLDKNTKISVQPIEIKNRLRDDKPTDCLPQDKAIENSTHKKDGYFKGPKAI